MSSAEGSKVCSVNNGDNEDEMSFLGGLRQNTITGNSSLTPDSGILNSSSHALSFYFGNFRET